MLVKERYESAKEMYEKIGVDTDAAIAAVVNKAISMHCWQGDDVNGFDQVGALSGGIQTTGNYMGKARNAEELMKDIEFTLKLIPGNHRINLHACYPIFKDGEWVDRDAIEPKHFEAWVTFAKEHNLKLDFNPTCFSHPLATGLSLSNPKKEIRDFWIRHVKACIRISEYFAEELDSPCLMNIWIPDGLKDIPGDRLVLRSYLKESLDEILSMEYDKNKVDIAVESKVFGIGVESYTVGSHEFYMNYAASKGILCLLDNGHYHPTEQVSDKLSSMLLFNEKLALHVTRPVRWDSDHVVLFDDETKEIAKEIVRCNAMDRVLIGLDFFDASINRIAAWVVGMRNMQKALLFALLQPTKTLTDLQEAGKYSELLVLQEELKCYPFADVWNYLCEMQSVPVQQAWFEAVKEYEVNVLSKRV